MKKFRLITTILFLAGISLLLYLNSPPSGMKESAFTVEYGESTRMIARNLRKNNLIRSSEFFVAASYAGGKRFVRAGRYRIFAGSTAR